jgi:hypothetical protein
MKEGFVKMKKMLGLAAAAALSCNATAQMRDGFVYYGAALQGHAYEDLLLKNRLSAQGRNLGYRLFTGYQFNRWVGVEIGAQQLGDADFLLKNATNTNVLAQTDFKTKALDAKLVLSYSFADDWFVRAQTGVLAWRNSRTDISLSPLTSNKLKTSGEDTLYGAGIGYSISQDYAMTLELEKSKVAGQAVTGISLNLMTKF